MKVIQGKQLINFTGIGRSRSRQHGRHDSSASLHGSAVPVNGEFLTRRCRPSPVYLLLAVPLLAGAQEGGPEIRTNFFNDPFQKVTGAIAQCPVPEGPLLTAAQAVSQSHMRAEKGTTCHYYGRCRLPNAYLYDQDIVPRVARFITLDPRFADSSIWLLGQRRWVYLKGCVRDEKQSRELEAEVRLIDDVEAVVNELMIGAGGKPPYSTLAR